MYILCKEEQIALDIFTSFSVLRHIKTQEVPNHLSLPWALKSHKRMLVYFNFIKPTYWKAAFEEKTLRGNWNVAVQTICGSDF